MKPERRTWDFSFEARRTWLLSMEGLLLFMEEYRLFEPKTVKLSCSVSLKQPICCSRTRLINQALHQSRSIIRSCYHRCSLNSCSHDRIFSVLSFLWNTSHQLKMSLRKFFHLTETVTIFVLELEFSFSWWNSNDFLSSYPFFELEPLSFWPIYLHKARTSDIVPILIRESTRSYLCWGLNDCAIFLYTACRLGWEWIVK